MNKPIYLDYNATTPLDPRVLSDMMPFLTDMYGNAASRHTYGFVAEQAVELCRYDIRQMIGDKKSVPGRLVFTSGATESNNLALKGFVRTHSSRLQPSRIITSAIEHKCILATCQQLSREQQEIVVLPVDNHGLVRSTDLEEALSASNAETLVSIMTANNEVGTIQDIKTLALIAHKYSALFHTDAAQALGKISVDVDDGIDMLSMSAHKFYGPKGIGALWIRDKTCIRSPIIHGGGQEYGLRSGTLNVPGIVGMASALKYAIKDLTTESEHISYLRSVMWDVFKNIEDVKLNGADHRLPGNLSVSFKYVDAAQLISDVESVAAISGGSACTSASIEPSHVLKAMGLSEEELRSTVRICVGRQTSYDDAHSAAQFIAMTVERIREHSDLWKMRSVFQR